MTHLFISAYCCHQSSDICIHLYQCTILRISYLHGPGPTRFLSRSSPLLPAARPAPPRCLACPSRTSPLPVLYLSAPTPAPLRFRSNTLPIFYGVTSSTCTNNLNDQSCEDEQQWMVRKAWVEKWSVSHLELSECTHCEERRSCCGSDIRWELVTSRDIHCI